MNLAENLKQIDYSGIKEKQKVIWASGDYARIGSTLQIVGEELAEAMDIRADQKVLDIAAGNGNFTIAAARRWADTTSTDYVDSLLQNGKARATANGLNPTFQFADAEELPFEDNSFDAAGSTFGVMFAPDQEKAAAEMLRVVRKAGKIGLANWTPTGFIGSVLKIVSSHVQPPAGVKPPVLWGTDSQVNTLFGDKAEEINIIRKHYNFRYRSADHWLDVFRQFYGPLHKAFLALDEAGQETLTNDIRELISSMNQSGDNTMLVPGEYLEIVITK